MSRSALGALILAVAPLVLAAWSTPALAQGPLFSPGPAPANQNPACTRLEAQLSAIDRGAVDPARAAQIKRNEEAVAKQQADLDRVVAQSRRIGCEGAGIFSLFTSQPAQCGPLNGQIQQMRSNLAQAMSESQRSQPGTGEQENQRQTVLAALSQNNCGPQYRAAANQQRGFFDVIFGNNSTSLGVPDAIPSGSYRTLCVRTCDGYYFPISFATSPSRFRDDEETCRRMCPAAEVALYSHRNPGEEMRQAVSTGGKLYGDLPNAFRYRQQFDSACSCRQAGQSWAEAMSPSKDSTVERGDIVVTDEKARAMAQPKSDPRAARPDPRRTDQKANPLVDSSSASTPAAAPPPSPVDARSIRTVGPSPYPVR